MATSSILRADRAPPRAEGPNVETLGPSDSSGSDTGADVKPDKVQRVSRRVAPEDDMARIERELRELDELTAEFDAEDLPELEEERIPDEDEH